jgi:prepilin-type N-terminal cleavage/methylation domain-containing protein
LSRHGFTLVEVVIASAIMAVIMTGLASAVLIATHALPDEQSASAVTGKSAETVDRLVEELRTALWLTERRATGVTFTVPDRDGDHVPERIRYAWSGVLGDPLTRQYNGSSARAILGDVREFDLSYALEAVTEEYSGAPVESAEEELCSYKSWYDAKEYQVKNDRWYAQYFEPGPFPADVLSWRVTRVLFVAKKEDNNYATTYVQLRTAEPDDTPSDTIVAQVDMHESTLSGDWAWKEISFSDASGLTPGAGLCLVFQHDGSGEASARLRYEDDFSSGLFESQDKGATWTPRSPEGLYHYVYGTYSTPGPPQTAVRYYVTGVEVGLLAGDDPATRVVTTAETLNTPQLLSGLWELDFSTDPTLDHNGDGIDDWVASGGFNPGSLSGGLWSGDTRLGSNPASDFAGLTTVSVRFRDMSADSVGAVFVVTADWSGGTCALLLGQVVLQADKTQVLTVSSQQGDLSIKALTTITGLSEDFVTLRLLVDPDLDTVNVNVDGVDHGTYYYPTITPAIDDRCVMLYRAGGSVEYDHVSVRVSE